jgi:hypothetical protein
LPAVQPLDAIPVLLFFVLFALFSLACYEGAFRLGCWVQDRTDVEEEGPTGVLVGSIVALMAFLLAITTGMASDRYDSRRLAVLEEANAIHTAYLRAGYIAEPGSSEARTLLAAYVPLRITTTSDPIALEAGILKSEELQRQLWAVAEDAARQDSSDVTALFVESVNDLITTHEERVTAGVYARVPPTILWILIFGSALSLGMLGYSAGLTKKRSPVSAIALVISLGAVLTLAVDLDRPRDGFIQVSQQPLIDLQRQIEGTP